MNSRLHRVVRSDLVQYALWVLGWLLILTIGMTIAGCAVDRASMPPDMVGEWDRLEAAEAAAAETPDPSDDILVEAQWEELESRAAKRQAGPFAALLPYGLGAIALEVVGAVGSRRKRKLYGKAIKNISSGQVAASVGDALKAWGVQHSSPPQASPQPPSES